MQGSWLLNSDPNYNVSMSDISNYADSFDLEWGAAQMMLQMHTNFSNEELFTRGAHFDEGLGDLIGTKLKIQIKLYNGNFTDNWILLSVTLDVNDLIDALLIDSDTLTIHSSVPAKLSYGRYFEALTEKQCKVEGMQIIKNQLIWGKEGYIV
jgi:hypothetical protein